MNPKVKFILINIVLGVIFYFVTFLSVKQYLDFYSNHGEEIAVPNLLGKKSSEAKMKLEELGLSYEILDSIYDPDLPNGIVKKQIIEPTAISKVHVKANRIIGLQLSKKSDLKEIPNLVFKGADGAKGILENRGFTVVIQNKPSIEAHGAVLELLYKGKPVPAGKRIPIGAEITLIVGKNEVGMLTSLPNIVGMNYQDALNLMSATGFTSISTSCGDCETKQDTLSAVVFGQTPAYVPEIRVERARPIVIFIESGSNEIEEPIE